VIELDGHGRSSLATGSSAGRIIVLAEECVGVIVGELPTGTVTLVFTDIEGSTRMLRALGDHQRSQLSRRLEPASAALGRDALALAAEDVAGGGP
jgi:class 3 adenylate cyclase